MGRHRRRRTLALVAAVTCTVAAALVAPPTCEAAFVNNAQLQNALITQAALSPLPPSPPIVTLLVEVPSVYDPGRYRLWTRPSSRLAPTLLVRPPASLAATGMYVGVAAPPGPAMPQIVYLIRAGDAAGLIVGEAFQGAGPIDGVLVNPSSPTGPGRDVMVRVPFVAQGSWFVYRVDGPNAVTLIVARDFGPAPPPQGGIQGQF